jgi:hypothetical protein
VPARPALAGYLNATDYLTDPQDAPVTSTEYSAKLKDPKWQRRRLEILGRDDFRCRLCQDTAATLAVHHLAYTAAQPWDEPESNLITVCEHCHELIKHPRGRHQVRAFQMILAATDLFRRMQTSDGLSASAPPAPSAHLGAEEAYFAKKRARELPLADEDLFT